MATYLGLIITAITGWPWWWRQTVTVIPFAPNTMGVVTTVCLWRRRHQCIPHCWCECCVVFYNNELAKLFTSSPCLLNNDVLPLNKSPKMRATFYPSDIYFFKRADFRQPTWHGACLRRTQTTHTHTKCWIHFWISCGTVPNYVYIYFVPFQTHFDGFPWLNKYKVEECETIMSRRFSFQICFSVFRESCASFRLSSDEWWLLCLRKNWSIFA